MKRAFDVLLSGACAAILATAALPADAQAADPVVTISLPAGPMQTSLVTLAKQADVKILFETDLVSSLQAPALQGRFTARQAAQQLLEGSDVRVEQIRPGVLVLRSLRSPVSTQPTGSETDPFEQGARSADLTSSPQDPVMVDEIVVGSHIRGGRDRASPLIMLDREAIDSGGHATVAEALAALPQTFSGTASDQTGAIGADATGTNTGRATGVNLRGLGADATLVLVNGRRMAGAGIMADFADVSSLPLSAVERIDILLDGASALYGSDAVGGVVNVVMRDRYEGVETRARIGGATQGGLSQSQASQTFGKAWDTGSVLLSAEYQRRDHALARDRAYTADADLRALGGADHRLFYAHPGNVLSASFTPAYAIATKQNGASLSPTAFLAGQVNYENQNGPIDILPTQERFAVYASATHDLGSRLSLNGEVRYSDRRYTLRNLAPIAALTVTSANPYFVSADGAASSTIAYSFQDETGPSRNTGSVQSSNLAFGAKLDLPRDWRLDAYVAHGQELSLNRNTGQVNAAALNEALGNTADSPLSGFSAARDGYFNPYTGQGGNTATVLDFVTSGWDARRTIGRLDIASATADGAIFALPAGSVRLALGAQVRTEALKTTGVSTTSSFKPLAAFSRRGERTVSAVFAETRIPLFGGDVQRPGLARLEISAAVRREHYEGGMAATTPKFGLTWAPITDLSLRTTYGESFRAPSIGELTDPQGATPVRLSNGSVPVLTLILYGGNPDLKPETAKSWTAGFDYAPADRPQLRLSGTLFKTQFEQRIGRPAISYLSTILTAADLAPFRTPVDPANNAADLALVKTYLANTTASAQALFPAQAYGAIGDARYVNAGAFTVEGMDLTGRYQAHLGSDPLALSANLSWIMHYKRKVTATSTAVELAGFASYPADLRARVSAAWTHGALTTTASLNHIGDLQTESGRRMPALTTADLQVQWSPKAQSGPWRGTVVALTVQNLLDSDPPFYDAPQYVGYDAANYDPSGRVIALQLTKAW